MSHNGIKGVYKLGRASRRYSVWISLTLLTMSLWVMGRPAVTPQFSGNFELTLSRDGASWKGEAKLLTPREQPLSAVRDLTVVNDQLSFTTNLQALELRFSGRLVDENLSGTVEGYQGSNRILAGPWSLSRQKTGSPSGDLTGRWTGSFSLDSTARPNTESGGDLAFNATVSRLAYPKNHPNVLFDEGHNNADTSVGRYKPFADLITSDGYRVVGNKQRFSVSALKGNDVLVIVNASGPREQRGATAFTEAECDSVRDWVEAGGALLLITDHAPFSSAASALAKRFGAELTIGHTFDTSAYNKESGDQTELLFTRENGLLGDHPITRGRDENERINRILTFSGTSVKGARGSTPLLKLADTAMDVLPPDRKPSSPDQPLPDHKTVSAAGRAQGLALEFGKGRVVILAEAAMLTAQVAPSGFHYGMNLPDFDNRQFALNTMHWLSGLLK